ncbi:hypothetical protein D3C76_1752790 [compost metagenome]
MYRMSHTDSESVAVATGSNNRQIAICQFDALGDRKRTSVNPVQTVCVNVTGNPAGTADP